MRIVCRIKLDIKCESSADDSHQISILIWFLREETDIDSIAFYDL